MATFRKVLAAASAAALLFTFLPASHGASGEPYVLALRGAQRHSSDQHIDSAQVERLRRIMTPLLKAMNHPLSPDQVQVGIISDPDINAANAGNGKFYVTTGLLQKANDEHLRGVMAHEIAHEDLGHVAKAQLLGAGLNIGMVLLEQVFPASQAVAPIAGTLIARGYSRSEEYQADEHGVEILRRAGYSKQVMIDALTWVRRTSGEGGGGFLSTHPGLDERITALQKMR